MFIMWKPNDETKIAAITRQTWRVLEGQTYLSLHSLLCLRTQDERSRGGSSRKKNKAQDWEQHRKISGPFFKKYIITKLLCCYHYCIWQKELIYEIKNADKEKIESMWPSCFLLDTSYLLMSSWMMHWRPGRGQNHGLKKNIQQNNWHH